MSLYSLKNVTLGICLGLFGLVSAAIFTVFHSLAEMKSRAEAQISSQHASAPLSLPVGRPEVGQRSIDIAMKLYAITIPEHVKGPFYSQELEDRGLTMRRGIASDAVVYIGKEAFSSWALLGSTLAHEIEVHCRQNFLAIHFQNLSGFDGTGLAEREAYRYELAHADRFGLQQYDRELISSTVAFFYPEQENMYVQKFAPLKLWLDRLSANGFGKRAF